MKNASIQIIRLSGLPMVGPEIDLAAEIIAAMGRAKISFRAGDVLVAAQKVISKVEGRMRLMSDFHPCPRALELAEIVLKDPRLVEAILSESREVIRAAPNVLIVEHRLGHIMANAGIDQSNLGPDADEAVLLLPIDPDASAWRLRERLCPDGAPRIGVVISDSFGRPWRRGTTGVALGVCAVPAVVDRRGEPDIFGRKMQVTEVAIADAIAAAGVLAMGEGDEGIPVVIVRGLDWPESDQRSVDGLRDRETDLFR